MVRIALDDIDKDNFTDIKVFPLDGCLQYRWDLINTNDSSEVFREYREEENNL